ncbi:MAG: OmpA family protein, partial [Aquincola sp.]|nr:OmpA family protein [Aquincola sp.]
SACGGSCARRPAGAGAVCDRQERPRRAAQKEIARAVDLLKGTPDAKVALSGYVDSSGSAAKNAELAKQRAFAVRDALTKAGVAAARIELRKPEQIDAGDAARARRVDIVSAS